MASPVSQNRIFNYWWEDLKWSGVFKVNWVYVKDISFHNMQNMTSGGALVSTLKDGSNVDFETGQKML